VNPLAIKLREGAEPVRMSARKYAPPQLKFMRDKIRELEELGLVYKNTGAEWASPPLTSESRKARRLLVEKNRLSKSMLVA
jgi:hypothetical protein